jgi:hypothetical protein
MVEELLVYVQEARYCLALGVWGGVYNMNQL